MPASTVPQPLAAKLPTKHSAAYHSIGGPNGYLANLQAFEGNSMSAYWTFDEPRPWNDTFGGRFDNDWTNSDEPRWVYRIKSYRTIIAEYDPTALTLTTTVNWWSTTTGRQLTLAAAWTARSERKHEVVYTDSRYGM